MNSIDNLEMLSDYYMVLTNFPVFSKANDEGIPVPEIYSKDAAKWRKLWLLYYSRSKQRYYLTKHSKGIYEKVLKEI